MGLRINTNIQSLTAQRFLTQNTEAQKNAMDHLASGSRINRSGEDAAGLAISEHLKSMIRSIRQATRNAQDGVSMIQVAEGSMNEIGNILIRLRELSIQAASDTVGNVERGFIDKEVQQLKSEVDRISGTTEYGGTKLLNGSTPLLEVQVGVKNNPAEDRFVFDGSQLKTDLSSLGLQDVSAATKEGAQNNLEAVDQAISHLNDNRSTLGALQNRMTSTINNLNIYRENMEAANSRIRDTDIAAETTEMTKYNVLSAANVAVLGQANQIPQLALKLLG